MKSSFDDVYLFSPTAESDEEYTFIPHENRFEKLNTIFIDKLIEYQKKTPKDKRPHYLLIMDDLIGEKTGKMTHNLVLDALSAKSRHFNVSMIISCQIASKISTTIRENALYIFITYKQRLEILFEQTENWKNKAAFANYCAKNLKQFHSLLLCNSPKTPERAALILPVDEQYRTDYIPEDEDEL